MMGTLDSFRSTDSRYNTGYYRGHRITQAPKPKEEHQPLGLDSIPRFGKYGRSYYTVADIFRKDRSYFDWAVKEGLFKQPTPEDIEAMGGVA